MTFPTPFTVGWHTFSEGAVNDRNTPVAVYTPDLESDGAVRAVMGWAPTQQSEPNEVRVVSGLDLLVPAGWVSGPRDVADVPGEGRFEQVGHPQDFSRGPFGFAPGKVVKLERVQQ